MGRKSGDKGRFYRERRKKLARRVRMRAHFGGKALQKEGTGETPFEAGKVRPAKASSVG
jgi:hypothetical protein